MKRKPAAAQPPRRPAPAASPEPHLRPVPREQPTAPANAPQAQWPFPLGNALYF